MEKLILTSRILYDNDISNKMKEISELKQEFKPEIIFSSQEELEENKEKAFAIIKDYINYYYCRVYPIDGDGLFLKHPTDVMLMFHGIEEALNLITKNKYKTWCNNQSWIILNSILGFINGLLKTGALITVWEDIPEIIYTCIIEQLELPYESLNNYGLGYDDVTGILQNICFIRCEKCERLVKAIEMEGNGGACWECEDDEV